METLRKIIVTLYAFSCFSHLLLSQTWGEVPNSPQHSIRHNDVWMLNDREGWVVNGSGDIFHTIDSAKTWTAIYHKEYTHFRAVCFWDSLNGIVANVGTDVFAGALDTVPLYRTIDGGKNWQVIPNIQVKGICNFYQYNEAILMGTGRVGGGGFFLKTKDKGNNWEVYNFSKQIGMAIDCYFKTEKEGFIFGGTDSILSLAHPAIWHTKDGGTTWDKIFEAKETVGGICWKVCFPTANVGYVSILDHKNKGTFIKTQNGGKTWKSYTLIDKVYASKGLYFIDKYKGWIGGDEKQNALFTEDGGKTWREDKNLGFSINRFRKVKSRVIAVGKSIFILKRNN